MKTHPNCKINLGLHVTERRADGYHNLESIFLPVFDLCDELEIDALPGQAAGVCDFIQQGIPIEGSTEDNLCVRAYRLLHEEFPRQVGAVRMRLDKQIPFGAGLGGGSSDAAFTLRMLNEMFRLNLSDEDLCQRAARIGADCPFFIYDKPAYVTGIGDQMEPLDFSLESKGLRIVIKKPDEAVSTREAYGGIVPRNKRQGLVTPDLREALQRPVREWKTLFVNDFEASVFPSHLAIARLKEQFYQQGAIYASMTGSGSAVFALFE